MKSFTPTLLVYDFDGVMTNNQALIFQDGTEAVFVNRSDGWGVSELRKAGFKQIILSTESNLVVSSRAKKLLIDVIQGSIDKARDLIFFCATNNIDLKKVLYVGNDVNDLDVMGKVGFTVCPSDAHPDVQKISMFITNAAGGEGVIKELSEWILKKS